MMVAVPMCELLFPTSVYGLYLPRISHSYPCYSLGIIVQTSEYFIINRRSKYLLYYLMPCMPSGIALMGSTLENAGVELRCTITGARQNLS